MSVDPQAFIQKWEPQLRKGVLEFVVLLCLRKRKYYGYELIRSVGEMTTLTISEGTIYPLLNRLNEEGLIAPERVEQESGKPRKYYCLTDHGKAVLSEMEEVWTDLNAALLKLMFAR